MTKEKTLRITVGIPPKNTFSNEPYDRTVSMDIFFTEYGDFSDTIRSLVNSDIDEDYSYYVYTINDVPVQEAFNAVRLIVENGFLERFNFKVIAEAEDTLIIKLFAN